jgi:hypothetical protein
MSAMLHRGARFQASHQLRALVFSALLTGAPPVLACDYPDEGTMPLRRALTRVKMLPETEVWQRERKDAGSHVEFRLLLEKEVFLNRKCHWTVEALADGKLWRTFYVTPDGKSVLIAYELPSEKAAPRPATPPPGSTATRP